MYDGHRCWIRAHQLGTAIPEAYTETCTLFIVPCAEQRNVVLGVIWSFIIMANPGDSTGTVGAQQMVPITELRSTVLELVKEPKGGDSWPELRDGGKDDD